MHKSDRKKEIYECFNPRLHFRLLPTPSHIVHYSIFSLFYLCTFSSAPFSLLYKLIFKRLNYTVLIKSYRTPPKQKLYILRVPTLHICAIRGILHPQKCHLYVNYSPQVTIHFFFTKVICRGP